MTNEWPFLRLRRPCSTCPFRTDKSFHLHPERAAQIAHDLRQDIPFHCHNTVDYQDEGQDTTDSAFCAGALIVCAKEGTHVQMVQLAQRLLGYDPSVLDLTAPVPDSLAAWVKFMEDE